LADNSLSGGSTLTKFYAKDPFFSLGKQEPLTGTAGNFTGQATITMGDLTNNNVINVSDLAVWAANNGTAMSPDTTLAQPAIPRQANVDGAGIVDLGDRNIILASWLGAGDGNSVGNFRGGDGSVYVKDAIRETGLSAKLLMMMDADHDGLLTKEEVLLWRLRH
jgi:hypothetical protein